VSFELLPAVDVADGRAVRLVQGRAGTETGYGAPLAAALSWQRNGAEWIHLVDLDAAFGRGSNAALLAEVVAAVDVKVEMSGGIRDDASLERALATGCSTTSRRACRAFTRRRASRPWADTAPPRPSSSSVTEFRCCSTRLGA
jgi:phosphoribosylformimino-5-aminoimidazole carboxamide ribonucleotide (ProFAR) isomerase